MLSESQPNPCCPRWAGLGPTGPTCTLTPQLQCLGSNPSPSLSSCTTSGPRRPQLDKGTRSSTCPQRWVGRKQLQGREAVSSSCAAGSTDSLVGVTYYLLLRGVSVSLRTAPSGSPPHPGQVEASCCSTFFNCHFTPAQQVTFLLPTSSKSAATYPGSHTPRPEPGGEPRAESYM